MKAARAYESPLRAEQMEQTRLRILRAVTDLVADPTADEVTIPLVARRARVSLRTVYRHFPTRDALFDAWGDWVERSLDVRLHTYPETADELAEFAPDLYESYDQNEALIRAMLNSKPARRARERTRRRRKRSFERAMRELTAGLEPAERARALAVVYLLVSAPAWQAMRDQWALDGIEAGKAAAWAVRVLVDELRRTPDSIKDSKEVRP
jgi:AcrR family transcriptional regulator